jgi:hypothetical protein
LYFDGKKTLTRFVKTNEVGNKKQVSIRKENLVLVQEPGNNFISHVTPDSANAEDTSNAIINKLRSMNISIENLMVIGGDGCAVNTGHISGTMRRIETIIGKELLRAICMLHLVELLLKWVYEFYYGVSKGPEDFGEIDDDLKTCHEMKVCKFRRIIPKNFPNFEIDGLSRDQAYLFSMGLAVKTGQVSPRLASKTPGKLCRSRWLTLASRILRLFVTQKKPNRKLSAVAKFVMTCYIPHWHAVKTKSSVSFGPLHFLNLIKSTRF